MLTGMVPFDGDNPVTVALMHVNDEMTPPGKIVSGIPPRLEQIVMKATDKIQVNRYKSADDMLEALSTLEYVTSIVGDSAAGVGRRPVNQTPETQEEVTEEKEEPEQGVKKGKKRFKMNKLRLIAVVLALLCGIPASIFVASFFIGSKEKPITEIAVPDVMGLTFERAEEELLELELNIQKGDEVISIEYDEGRVVSQDPAPETLVKPGFTVTVNISKGTREGTIPKITGVNYQDALFLIEKYGFQAGPPVRVKDNAPKNIVISQTPEPGTEAKPGTTINFVVSDGKAEEETAMPALVGMDIEDAKKALQEAGLTLAGTPEAEINLEYAEGKVIWQQHRAGEMVLKGSAVSLKVSAGSEPQGPKSVAIEINYSNLVENQVFFMTVTVSDDEGTRNIFTEQQRIKDDLSEIVTFSGTGTGTVTVIIDGQIVMRRNVDFNTGEID